MSESVPKAIYKDLAVAPNGSFERRIDAQDDHFQQFFWDVGDSAFGKDLKIPERNPPGKLNSSGSDLRRSNPLVAT